MIVKNSKAAISIVILTILFFADLSFASPSLFGEDKIAKYENEHTTWVYPPWKHTWGVVRATQKHLTLFTLSKARFINPQGMCAVRLTKTDDPAKRGDDDEVTVYGVNTGENSIIYNKSMTAIGLYGYDEEGEELLNEPWDITALPNGLVFVSDSRNSRVVKLRNINGELSYEKSFGNGAENRLELPRGIAVTAGGRVFVADAQKQTVVQFDTIGIYVREYQGFISPTGLAAVDRKEYNSHPKLDYFVVSDSGGKRIQKFSFEGEKLFSVDVEAATGLKNVYCGHLETDLYHNVIAVDSVNNKILKFSRKLEFISEWGEKGKGRTRFKNPTGIAICKRFGQTFIAEKRGAHYLWVGVDHIYPPKLEVDTESQKIDFLFNLTDNAEISLEIVNIDEEVLRTKKFRIRQGEKEIKWNVNYKPNVSYQDGKKLVGPKKDFDPLIEGEYRLIIRAKAFYSSSKSFEKVLETTIGF
jgi:NHL repeat-containing protein